MRRLLRRDLLQGSRRDSRLLLSATDARGLRPRTAADAPYAEGIKLIGFNQGNSYGTVTTNYYESDKSYTFTIGLMQNGVTKIYP